MQHVILLNGPPRSGKDVVGRMITYQLSTKDIPSGIDKMVAPVDAILQKVLMLDDCLFAMYREEKKDKKLPGFDKTLRELMISFSEDFIKPNLGQDYFGMACGVRILERKVPNNYVTIITDTGFQYEHDACVKLLEPNIKAHTVQIHRTNTNFDNDSREWVEGHKTTIFKNDGSLELSEFRVERLLTELGITT